MMVEIYVKTIFVLTEILPKRIIYTEWNENNSRRGWLKEPIYTIWGPNVIVVGFSDGRYFTNCDFFLLISKSRKHQSFLGRPVTVISRLQSIPANPWIVKFHDIASMWYCEISRYPYFPAWLMTMQHRGSSVKDILTDGRLLPRTPNTRMNF